jgi:hypothetical protein
VFSFPCFRRGLPGATADLCMILSSTFDVELLKYDSSAARVLLFPGVKGAPACRPSFVGLLSAEKFSFMAFSKAVGRSLAPGGFCFLLGLPCGVDTGVMKLFRLGVFGLSLNWSLERAWREGAAKVVSFFPPCEEGKRLLRKFDIVDWAQLRGGKGLAVYSEAGVADDRALQRARGSKKSSVSRFQLLGNNLGRAERRDLRRLKDVELEEDLPGPW